MTTPVRIDPKAAARRWYEQSFENHAIAEQLAVFRSEFEVAHDHRTAIEIVLARGDEEVFAQPFREGAW